MLKQFFIFLKHILSNKKLLVTLIVNDFKKQYLGSYLGIFWAFAQPLMFMVVIWFVFQKGFRSAPTSDGMPFFLWLVSGMVPWFFIVNSITSGANAIVANAFLVKKVAFRVSILPMVQIGSALIIHLGLVIFLLIAFVLYGYYPTLYWMQLLYYLFASLVLLLGISWLTSALRVFVKDIGNIIAVILQVGFWATPIFWKLDMIPQKYKWIFEINPAYYIVEGYRDSLIYHVWFWQKPFMSGSFWIITLFFFFIGALVFKKLRPHFGDVL